MNKNLRLFASLTIIFVVLAWVLVPHRLLVDYWWIAGLSGAALLPAFLYFFLSFTLQEELSVQTKTGFFSVPLKTKYSRVLLLLSAIGFVLGTIGASKLGVEQMTLRVDKPESCEFSQKDGELRLSVNGAILDHSTVQAGASTLSFPLPQRIFVGGEAEVEMQYAAEDCQCKSAGTVAVGWPEQWDAWLGKAVELRLGTELDCEGYEKQMKQVIDALEDELALLIAAESGDDAICDALFKKAAAFKVKWEKDYQSAELKTCKEQFRALQQAFAEFSKQYETICP